MNKSIVPNRTPMGTDQFSPDRFVARAEFPRCCPAFRLVLPVPGCSVPCLVGATRKHKNTRTHTHQKTDSVSAMENTSLWYNHSLLLFVVSVSVAVVVVALAVVVVVLFVFVALDLVTDKCFPTQMHTAKHCLSLILSLALFSLESCPLSYVHIR